MNRVDDEAFTFRRGRGVAWVCDIESSTRHLNDNTTAGELEKFLPRLHQAASILVSSAGGVFVKWTGDGFLAWFETPLHRDLAAVTLTVFHAVLHLTLIVNVTQLDTEPSRPFKLRHAVTYEKDALVTSIHADGLQSNMDLIGRDIVLAFRMSGISASFPGLVTQKELVGAYAEAQGRYLNFRHWKPGPDDLLKHFKGERRGTKSVYLSSANMRPKKVSTRTLLQRSRKAIAVVEGEQEPDPTSYKIMIAFTSKFKNGAAWRHRTIETYTDFIKNTLAGALKSMIKTLESAAPPNTGSDALECKSKNPPR